MFSENFFEKITKNVIFRKLQGFVQSYFKARIATPEITLTPNYRFENFKICDCFFFNLSFLRNFEKIKEIVVSRKLKGFQTRNPCGNPYSTGLLISRLTK